MSRRRRSRKKGRKQGQNSKPPSGKTQKHLAPENTRSRAQSEPQSTEGNPRESRDDTFLEFADQPDGENRWSFGNQRLASLSIGFLAAVGFISIPFVYWWMTSLPSATRVAGGVESGQYRIVAESLRQSLTRRITRAHNMVGFKAEKEHSRGSLDNLRKLQCGETDFGLYQVGTLDELREEEFNELDTGGNNDGTSDGQLDKAEFRGHFDNEIFDEKEIALRTENAFQKLDEDRSGKLSLREFNEVSEVRFVSNLYDDVLHVITLNEGSIRQLTDLQGMKVGFGFKYSGNYAASRMLFRSVGLSVEESQSKSTAADLPEITPFPSDDDWDNRTEDEKDLDVYELMRKRLKEGEIAAAVFIVGPDAKILTELFQDRELCLLDLSDQLEAIQHESMEFSEHAISKNQYGKIHPQIKFSNDQDELKTVSLRVQLLSHYGVDSNLVKLVTGVVMDEQFQKENGLRQLYTGSVAERESFARNRPGFQIHYGALVYYDGGFNPGEFAGWQAFYSLFASIGLAFAVTCRWIWRRRRRQREHRLNQYFNHLFTIEEQQLEFDRQASTDDLAPLQKCLDEITRLRQRAMQDFNAHELNDDAAFQAFLQACHYISQKVNAKLTRQRSGHFTERIVQSLDSLTDAIRGSNPANSGPK